MVIVGVILLAMVPVLMVWFLRQGAPFVRTSEERTRTILREVKRINPKRIIDLGCGDGTLVIALAQAGYKVDGIEIQPLLVWRARRKVKKLKLEHRVKIHRGSFWKLDASKYDAVVLFGIQHIMPKLERKLRAEMKPRSHIISNSFTFPNLKLVKQKGKIRTYIVSP
jgi:2-polyprenyl-3-methyl-5-hydroxy-6-metoxy-1,4-benzoquinol methylase